MAMAAAPRTPASPPACEGTIAEVLGRQGQGALVDDLADAGQQVLAGRGELTADDDDRRVDQVDHRGDDVADVAAGLAHDGDGVAVAGPDEVDDVLAVAGVDAARTQRGGQGGSGGDRLEAAEVAAAALDVAGPGDAHVPEVAGRALGAALQLAAGDDAGADAGGDLDQHEVVDVGEMGTPLAQRHDVDVVVDEDRDGVVALDVAGDVVPVPAGHDRRVDRAAGGVLDRAGQADADGGELGDLATVLAQQRAH